MSAEDQRAAEALREAEHVVVAALLQVPGRHAELPALPPEAFSDPQAKTLYKFVTDYRKHSGGRRVVDIPLARARLETSTRPETLALLPVLDGYDAAPVSDAEFADALATIQHGYATSVLREHSRHALEATLRGDADQARDQMRTALVEAEETAAHDEPPIDVRAEAAIEQEAGHVSLGADAPDPGFDSGFPTIRGSVSLRRGELVILGGYSGDGKALKVGTKVLTPTGWVPVEKIVVGDRVIGKNGRATEVVGVYPQGVRPIFRMTFSDETWVDSDADHQWAVQDINDAKASRHGG